MKNWAPFIVVLVLLVLLAVLFGPGWYRTVQLKQTVAGMIAAATEGRTADLVGYIHPAQQQEVAGLLSAALPADYPQYITSLRMTSWRKDGEDAALTVVTCKVRHGDFQGIYQGKLVWHYSGGQWEWDFLSSSGAEFSPSGEPAWIELSEFIPLAEHL